MRFDNSYKVQYDRQMIEIDPFKDFVPKQNTPSPVQATKSYVAGLSDTELRKLAREKLSEALQAVDATKDRDLAVRLSNAVLDRIDGKPSQSIAMTVEDKGITKLSDERLLRLEAELARMTGQDAIIIPPMPEKLHIDNTDG